MNPEHIPTNPKPLRSHRFRRCWQPEEAKPCNLGPWSTTERTLCATKCNTVGRWWQQSPAQAKLTRDKNCCNTIKQLIGFIDHVDQVIFMIGHDNSHDNHPSWQCYNKIVCLEVLVKTATWSHSLYATIYHYAIILHLSIWCLLCDNYSTTSIQISNPIHITCSWCDKCETLPRHKCPIPILSHNEITIALDMTNLSLAPTKTNVRQIWFIVFDIVNIHTCVNTKQQVNITSAWRMYILAKPSITITRSSNNTIAWYIHHPTNHHNNFHEEYSQRVGHNPLQIMLCAHPHPTIT